MKDEVLDPVVWSTKIIEDGSYLSAETPELRQARFQVLAEVARLHPEQIRTTMARIGNLGTSENTSIVGETTAQPPAQPPIQPPPCLNRSCIS